MKRISRIALATFVLVAVLAISAMAYTVNYDGTVSGLEDGVDYTYAQYDFANDTYGEFAELTDTTELTSGIWGIKAGDAEPEAIFVYGVDSGKTSFWTDGATAADNVFDNTTRDTYVPGKWTLSSDGAFNNIRCYKNATLTDTTVCIDVVKAKVIEKVTVTTDTQKTVTVEETEYPVFTIDGAEYYLNADKYYAVADNAEYTGEGTAEAVYLTEIDWVGIEGEANKSQESEYYYGFTNDQVIPMTELVKYQPRSVSAFTGGLPVDEDHTKEEISPKVTYFAKKIGSDEVIEYTVKITGYKANGNGFIALPPAEFDEDAYLVGFAVAPYDGLPDDYFTNLRKDGVWNTETAGYYHHSMYANSSNGVTVVVPEYKIAAPNITVSNGKFVGLEEGKHYEWSSVTINENGTAIDYTEPAVLTKDTKVAGLVVARLTSADRSIVGEWTDFIYVRGNSLNNIYHTTKGTDKNGNEKSFIDVTIHTGGWSENNTPKYNEAKWTGANLTNALAKNYGYDPLILGTTGGQGTMTYLNTTDATALAAAQKRAQKHLDAIYYSYKYTADEIIPMSLFESFKFKVASRQGGQKTNGTPVYTRITFKVITEDGKIVDRVVTKPAGQFAATTHTVTANDFTDKSGYIVAICIQPFTTEDATILKYGSGAMIDYNVYHFLDGYSVALPKADKPEGLYLEDGVIKGLDADVTYGWAYQYIDSTSAVVALPEGTTEIKGVTGLIAVMVVGGNVKNSDPVFFYIPGDNDALATLGVITDSKPAFETNINWAVGKWTGGFLSWHDQTTGAYSFLDQTAGVTAEHAQNLWLYQVTKEEAQSRLDADAAKTELPTSWVKNNIKSKPSRLQGYIDSHYTADYEATKDARKAELQQDIADAFALRSIRYAYDETEIIPVNQLVSVSFTSWRRQGGLILYDVQSKLEFTVMQLDGTTTTHEVWSNKFDVTANGGAKKLTFDVQAIEGLPTEGYIVGVEFFPWASMDASRIVYVLGASERVDAENIAYSFTQQHVCIGFYHAPYSDYKILSNAVAPELEYAPSVNGGYDVTIIDGNANFTYKYKAEGDAEWTELDSGVNTFNVTEAGKYLVEVSGENVAGTAVSSINVKPVTPTAPQIMYTPAKTGYSVKIENYFGAYTYEYKLASASKWTRLSSGINMFTVPATGEYIIRAGGSAYNGYAQTEFTVEALPAALESISITDKTITGLEADKIYEFAPVNVHGIGTFTKIPAGTEYTFTNAGLYAIRVAATATEQASTTIAVLAYGDLADRKTIINTSAKAYASGTYWDKTVTELEVLDIATYPDRLNPQFKEGVWTGYKIGDLGYWNKTWTTSLGVVSGCVQVKDLGNKLTSGEMTQQDVKDFIQSYGFRYQYKPTEIIPFEDLVSLNFEAGGRQGHIYAAGKAYTKVIAHVANAYGFVEARELLLETSFTSAGNVTKHVISAEDFGDTTGYIVGMEIIPYGYIPEETVMKVSGTTDSDWMVRLNSYEIALPRIETPTLTYNAETGLVEGLDENATYKYASYNVNGEGTVTTVTGVTTLELADGLWGIRMASASVENSDSLPAFVLIQSDAEGRKAIGTIKNYGSYEAYDVSSNDAAWRIGKWSGKDLTVHSSFGKYVIGTTGGHVLGNSAVALKNAIDAGNAEAEAAARENIVNLGNAVQFKYAYANDDIVSVNDLMNISFKVSKRMGSLNLGYATVKVHFSVLGPDGKVRVYTWESDRFDTQKATQFDVNPRFADKWPTEGYIVGIEINPWSDIDGSTVKVADNNGYNTMANLTLMPEKYSLVTGDEVAEKPILSFKALNNVITVTNYNKFLKYAYSADNGETWTVFDGDKFNATKANTAYIVKSLESLPYEESEYSDAITSAPVALVGTSLVLDGQIGIKVYMDVDMDVVGGIQHYMSKVNRDFEKDASQLQYGQGYKMGGGATLEEGCAWSTKIQLDEESGLYYFIIYIPAKDLDNTNFETDLGYWLKGEDKTNANRVQVSNVYINFASYITQAKGLAAAGDPEFAQALELVEALETYTNYADNYFNNGSDAAYVSTASTEGITAPTRTNAELVGVSFYGTSLLLEDQVTIRHYFAVEDLDAFNAAYKVEGMYGIKGNFIYFDIVDIPAQDLGKVKTLTIKDAEDNTAYEVTYSATNYIATMMNDDDVNLASLVNAMYDYYLAAAEYAK